MCQNMGVANTLSFEVADNVRICLHKGSNMTSSHGFLGEK
jgi:hypothetical protein